jgi:hypothetical protein
VFRDSGMATDSVITNFEQIFETNTCRKKEQKPAEETVEKQ